MPRKLVLVPYRLQAKLKPYMEAARAAGLEPTCVPAFGAISLDEYAGLFLIGGSDVNPKLYGETALPETEAPDDDRDAIELELIDQAIEKNLPIFAICRGLQILNVYHGGTLVQHLPSSGRHVRRNTDPAAPVHEVLIEPDSVLATAAGADRLAVNSRHHQGVGKTGARLRISARDAEDGTVEALERPDKRFVLAVQWHPEEQVFQSAEQLRLFQRFAEAL